jgi:hypothetical protein
VWYDLRKLGVGEDAAGRPSEQMQERYDAALGTLHPKLKGQKERLEARWGRDEEATLFEPAVWMMVLTL